MSKTLEIFTDGACSGNPGPSGLGVVVKEKGKIVRELSLGIGDATNNIAEYMAIVYALQEALIMHAENVYLFTDSELACNQINKIYKVKNSNIKLLFDQVQHLWTGFKKVSIVHIPREKNKDADALARKAIKQEQAKVVASQGQKELQREFFFDKA